MRYIAQLNTTKIILWCYLIWYLVMSIFHFEINLYLWGTAIGVAGVVGIALMLSTGDITMHRLRTRFWESFRLFLIPFCVSSFSGLIKGHGFILVFSPDLLQNLVGVVFIGVFVLLTLLIKYKYSSGADVNNKN